ncbi:MAG: HAMP domain-containing protein, partial [Chloroflexi bacterium]|nr:HAMP domain-containing protein [Chloroflexota bacterium]
MKRSISFKLALAFILAAVLTASVLAVVFLSTNRTSFEQYVFDQQFYTRLAAVEEYYAVNQTWEGVERVLTTNAGGMMGGFGGMHGNQGIGQGGQRKTEQPSSTEQSFQAGHMTGRQYALADANGRVLFGIEGLYEEGEVLSSETLSQGAAIQVDGLKVGTLLAPRRNVVYTQAEQLFLDRSKTSLLLALLLTVLVAALAGILLSRSLTRPVIELTAAAQNLAAGDLTQRVDVRSQDELGELSQAFNQMSAEIEHSDHLRKQLTADIAHDLRTPLTVIGGYIEAMRDGDLDPTAERLGMLYAEVTRLNHLVGDLRLLSQSEAGALSINLQHIEAVELLERTRELFDLRAQERGISLTLEAEQGLPLVLGDETRLIQVMENLLENAIRHTPEGGQVRLRASLDRLD